MSKSVREWCAFASHTQKHSPTTTSDVCGSRLDDDSHVDGGCLKVGEEEAVGDVG